MVSERTRSITRPSRVLVEKIKAPHAEMSTAGVIIAVSTASALAGDSRRVSQSIPVVYGVSSSIFRMKAIRAHAFGGPEVLKLDEVPDPIVGPGQVVVRVRAIGVNPYDTYMLTGNYATRPPL